MGIFIKSIIYLIFIYKTAAAKSPRRSEHYTVLYIFSEIHPVNIISHSSAVSSAISIICLNDVCLSSEVVASPVRR